MKPSFSLTSNYTQSDLHNEFNAFCAIVSSATGGSLNITRFGQFLVMTQDVQSNEVTELGAATVSHFDKFRAPLTDKDIEKRRRGRLTQKQEELMLRWGYPYVMQEFKFHMTLTDLLPNDAIDAIEQRANAWFYALLGQAVNINSLALMGEDNQSGRFHVIEKLSLGM